MRIYLVLLVMCVEISAGLECKMALSQEHCARLRERYHELAEEYKVTEGRKHINPTAFQSLERELVRLSLFTGLDLPGSSKEETQEHVNKYLEDEGVTTDADGSQGTSYANNAAVADDNDVTESHPVASDVDQSTYSNKYTDGDAKTGEKKTCHEWVSKEKCEELQRQYAILKELYGNETTKGMLNMDAYNDLHREMDEAGLSAEVKKTKINLEKKTCDESVSKEECDTLLKKYDTLKTMYADPSLKELMDPEAYNDLHREMVDAGLASDPKQVKDEKSYTSMQCDESVPKVTCDSLLKKYKVMKEMYNDADLKSMLNTDAYTELKREMEAAGLVATEESNEVKDKKSYSSMQCDESVPKVTCDSLLKKYKVMKEMYNDADLKLMLNADAYTELKREMEAAGLVATEESNEVKDKKSYTSMQCDESVPKVTCDSLLKKYKVMKEMYNDADLKSMLNADAYTELKQEMEAAGLVATEESNEVKDKKSYTSMQCDESVPKVTCDSLLKKYKVMKEMYNDADLKSMLNADAYTELKREMEAAGLVATEESNEDTKTKMNCHSSVSKEVCDSLMKRYKLMKEMYGDPELKKMLNSDAYSELEREMTEAGIEIDGSMMEEEDAGDKMKCHKSVSKEVCDSLLKKYNLMKKMYNDPELKTMLNPNAYNELDREMKEAGIEVEGSMKSEKYQDDKMKCHESVSKEDCDALLKKYKLMKKMYNDPELKKLLNPDAYNELDREMKEAGIEVEGSMKTEKYQDDKMKCHESVSKEDCDALLKKYKLMKKMYNDPELKELLNPDAYNELDREMKEAGIETEKSMEKDPMSCDKSVPEAVCNSLLKRYKLMKEMYGDPELKKMLNSEAYSELEREMTEAGIEIEGSMMEDMDKDMNCDSSIPKEKCDTLLKRYKLMKEMYLDSELKKMLNLDAYNELHRELQEAGVETKGSANKAKKGYNDKKCDESVSKEDCDTLMKKYETMKEMYNDPILKDMLDLNAYNDLHRQLEDAGVKVEEKAHNKTYDMMTKEPTTSPEQYPQIRTCSRDGLYRYDDHSFIFCSEGFGFVQRCPPGTKNGDGPVIAMGYGRQNFCTIKYLTTDATQSIDS